MHKRLIINEIVKRFALKRVKYLGALFSQKTIYIYAF
jgi:hypothetical protein